MLKKIIEFYESYDWNKDISEWRNHEEREGNAWQLEKAIFSCQKAEVNFLVIAGFYSLEKLYQKYSELSPQAILIIGDTICPKSKENKKIVEEFLEKESIKEFYFSHEKYGFCLIYKENAMVENAKITAKEMDTIEAPEKPKKTAGYIQDFLDGLTKEAEKANQTAEKIDKDCTIFRVEQEKKILTITKEIGDYRKNVMNKFAMIAKIAALDESKEYVLEIKEVIAVAPQGKK